MLVETICSAVSVAGLGIAAITAYRKRFLTAARIAAYALVPIGLVLTGVIDWVSDLVFNPTVWAGFGLLGLAWALLMTTRAVERRGGGTRQERKQARAARREAAAPAASAPSLGPGRTKAAQPAANEPGSAASQGEDFSDIEAILKKHGI
ncbi:hypothetical protein [Streptomyces sp. NPDC051219]|uniref:hypothetical protein n=1 Tax=Streptomyces sp. NPDC051219 TaxID=3155283 RepID=UPI0034186B73